MTDWSDLVARVRGLSGRLLAEHALHGLAQCRDLMMCATQLTTVGVLPAPLESPHPLTLELGVRRHAAQQLRLVGRWAGDRARLLAPLFEDEDRRSVRALLRGAASGTPTESRLAGLIPTPTLPERALMELSRRGDIAAVVAQLTVLASPYAAALSPEASRQHPELLRLEGALNRAFAIRAVDAAKHADAPLRSYVEGIIDVENVWSALVLSGAKAERPDQWFLDGGRRVSRTAFVALLQAPNDDERRRVLASATDAPWVRATMSDDPRREVVVLRSMIAQQRRFARVSPLGTAPIIEYVLRLRLEVIRLQEIVWSIAMRVPRMAVDRVGEKSA